eukprot:Ihof_evm2s905 gene=Ihof_evmTU2s905
MDEEQGDREGEEEEERKGLKAWIPCENEGFQQVTIVEVEEKRVVVTTQNGETITVPKPVHLRGDSKVADDLRNLNPLHDPAVLENTRTRFLQNIFYTYT